MPHVAISVAVDREQHQQQHPETRLRHRRRHRFVHRHRALDRQIGRGAANFRADAFDHAGGCGRARDERHEPHEPAAVLLERHVDHRLHVPIESPLTDVRDHAHHRQPLAVDRSKRTRRPSASPGPPGKYSRTMRSLTIATFGASAVSRAVKSRPASSGIPMVLK